MNEKNTMQCPACGAPVESSFSVCPYCGYINPQEESKPDEESGAETSFLAELIQEDQAESDLTPTSSASVTIAPQPTAVQPEPEQSSAAPMYSARTLRITGLVLWLISLLALIYMGYLFIRGQLPWGMLIAPLAGLVIALISIQVASRKESAQEKLSAQSILEEAFQQPVEMLEIPLPEITENVHDPKKPTPT